MKNLKCPNADCPCRRDGQAATIATHGFYKTRFGKRRRYRCVACNTTFSSTKGTAYYRLQHRRTLFDEVASLSVEGVNKSAISRVKGIGWVRGNQSQVMCQRDKRTIYPRIKLLELGPAQ